ncbi:MAG TPA: glycosyltransferase [Chloroflexota bacterium]|jgi:glycosyltransferase involved in cell wall biosynthesis|nr:glycosyltransferase [Chloroflexota bacterium]
MPAHTDTPPLLSVLIPVWKERERLMRLVAGFRALDYQPRELVLCAGGPDGSYEEALRWRARDILVLEQLAGEGKQRALERCFRASRGELLFLSDADAQLSSRAVDATLAPILAGEVEAATGTREPIPALQPLSIVAYQWALEAAGNAVTPQSSPGMLGSNAALTRGAAVRAGSFAWEARTGTDYSLACRLRQVGASIRFVPASRMPVSLATNLRDYSRQRARWLRTLVLIGWRYGDWAVVYQGLQPMLLGLVFSALPLAPGRLRRPALLLALALLLIGWRRRIGYVQAAPAPVRQVLTPRRWPLLALFTLVDLLTWARAAVEALVPAWRGRW